MRYVSMDKITKQIIDDVVESNFVMTLGTVVDKKPHLCTAFYVTQNNRVLYFKSRTASEHSRAFAKDNSASVSIYDPNSNYSERKAGIQTRGEIERVKDVSEMAKVVSLYAKSFKGAKKKFEAIPKLVSEFVKSTMYKYTIEEVKVMDSAKNVHDEVYKKV